MLINHTVSKILMEKMVDQVFAFFNLKEEEKQEYVGNYKDVTDPIRYGTGFDVSGDNVLFWRDFLKLIVHPEFHSPDKPPGFRFMLIFHSPPCESPIQFLKFLVTMVTEIINILN